MLDSLEIAAKEASHVAELGVIVVDDNPDRWALKVVEESERSFPLGLHYRWTGSGNIATARNAGLEAGLGMAEWVAMVDDDQIVVPEWLTELLATARDHDADAVTAPVYVRFPDDAPRWLVEQPFADLWGTPRKEDGAPVTDLQTATPSSGPRSCGSTRRSGSPPISARSAVRTWSSTGGPSTPACGPATA